MRGYDREKIEDNIRKLFIDFHQGENGEVEFPGGLDKFNLELDDYDKCRLIRYVLGENNHFLVYDRPFEKVNWSIFFYYKGIPGAVMHEKFGFYIYIDKSMDAENMTRVKAELQGILIRGLALAEEVIRNEAIKNIEIGKIIVENKYHRLLNMYRYFRDASKRKPRDNTKEIQRMVESNIVEKISKEELAKRVRDIKELIDKYSTPHERTVFNEEASYVAFFSFLEHLCLLSLPFSGSKYVDDVYAFSRLNWTDKYKEVFPISDATFKKSYDAFSNLARFRRNSSAHGYFDKMHTSFDFYFEPARHRIPVALYDNEVITKWHDKSTNFKELDDFISIIQSHPLTKNRMAYISYPFDISFDSTSLAQYKKINRYTQRGLDRFIEAESWRYTNALNMDH